MTSLQFIADFKALHEKAKRGSISAEERSRYLDARKRFASILAVAQQLGHAGKTLRADLRMSKVLKVELRPDGRDPVRTSTIDLASGGFAVLMGLGMPIGSGAEFALELPSGGGGESISGRCRVASSRPHSSLFRVSFKFDELAPAMQERLDVALIDAVLERLNAL